MMVRFLALACVTTMLQACGNTANCPADQAYDGETCSRVCNTGASDCLVSERCEGGFCRAAAGASSGNVGTSSSVGVASSSAVDSSNAPGSSASGTQASSGASMTSSGGGSGSSAQASSAGVSAASGTSSTSLPAFSAPSSGASGSGATSQPQPSSSAPQTSSSAAPGSSSGGVAGVSVQDLGMGLINSNDDIIPLTLSVAVPVGELLVVSMVTRGAGTMDVVDTANNTWLLDSEAVNGSGVETVAIYDCVLTHALPVGATITAILPQNTDRLRSIQGYWVHGLTQFDRANGAQDNGTRITVSTVQPLRGTQHVVFVALGTGFNDPTTYSGFAPFVEASHFSSAFSSGAHLWFTGTGLAGQPMVLTANANNDAQHVGVIVAFR